MISKTNNVRKCCNVIKLENDRVHPQSSL